MTSLTLAELDEIRMPNGDARQLVLANQKGGCGKSSTATNLGAFFASLGYRVLFIDVDPSATATKTWLGTDSTNTRTLTHLIELGLDPNRDLDTDPLPTTTMIIPLSDHLHLLAADQDLAGAEELITKRAGHDVLKAVVEPVLQQYDLILYDTLPSLLTLHIAPLRAANEVIIPLAATNYDVWGITELLGSIRLVRRQNKKLVVRGVVVNRGVRTRLSEEIKADLAATGLPLLGTIRQAVAIQEAPGYRQTIFDYAPNSPAANDYRDLGNTLIALWEQSARAEEVRRG